MEIHTDLRQRLKPQLINTYKSNEVLMRTNNGLSAGNTREKELENCGFITSFKPSNSPRSSGKTSPHNLCYNSVGLRKTMT